MNRKLRNLIIVLSILVIAAGISLLVNELNIRSHFKKGNSSYTCYDYDVAIMEYDKAMEGYFLEGRDCPIRVNKSLAMLQRDEILDGNMEDWDLDTLNKNMAIVEEVKTILLADGCACEDGSGHDAAAQQLYDDLCNIEREMEEEQQNKEQQQQQQNQSGGGDGQDGNDNQNNDNQNNGQGDGSDPQNQNGNGDGDDKNQGNQGGQDEANGGSDSQNGNDNQNGKDDQNGGGDDQNGKDDQNGGGDDQNGNDNQNGGGGADGGSDDGTSGGKSLEEIYGEDQNAANRERYMDSRSYEDYDWNFSGKCW